MNAPFLKTSRLFSICFCLALSGAAEMTLASRSFIWVLRWSSCSVRLCKTHDWLTEGSTHTLMLMCCQGSRAVWPGWWLYISPAYSSCLSAHIWLCAPSPPAAVSSAASPVAASPPYSKRSPFYPAAHNHRSLAREALKLWFFLKKIFSETKIKVFFVKLKKKK